MRVAAREFFPQVKQWANTARACTSPDNRAQAIGLVMASGGTWKLVRDALPVHPTVTEFLPTIIDRRKPLTASSG